MEEQVLIGKGREIPTIPWRVWEEGLGGRVPLVQARLGFMSEEHHLVRNFVVRELPQRGEPLSPEFISRSLNLVPARVNSIWRTWKKI